jgi:hypothetical protein
VDGDTAGEADDHGRYSRRNPWACMRSCSGWFYKKESQEKNVPHGWNFSCFAAHLNEQDSVLTGHTWTPGPSDWCFPYQRFSSLDRNEAYQFRNQQTRTAVKWRP